MVTLKVEKEIMCGLKKERESEREGERTRDREEVDKKTREREGLISVNWSSKIKRKNNKIKGT